MSNDFSNQFVVDTVTRINGKDAHKWGDSDILAFISEAKNKIKDLEELGNESSYVATEIQKIQKAIKKATKILDKRAEED